MHKKKNQQKFILKRSKIFKNQQNTEKKNTAIMDINNDEIKNKLHSSQKQTDNIPTNFESNEQFNINSDNEKENQVLLTSINNIQLDKCNISYKNPQFVSIIQFIINNTQKKPSYSQIIPSLLSYKTDYRKILQKLTRFYYSYMLPVTNYDIFRITPYDDNVSSFYNLKFRINASFVLTDNHIFIAAQKPKKPFHNHFIKFIQNACEYAISLTNEEDDYLTEAPSNTVMSNLQCKKCIHKGDEHCILDSSSNTENTIHSLDNTQNDHNHFPRNNILAIHKFNNFTRYKYTQWTDYSIPCLSQFLSFYNEYKKIKTSKPILVHCNAGVGRTGTFILYDILVRKKEKITYNVIIEELCKLRIQRNYLVFNDDQLKWLIRIFLTPV